MRDSRSLNGTAGWLANNDQSLTVEHKAIHSGFANVEQTMSVPSEKSVRLVVFNVADQLNAVEVGMVEEIILTPAVSPLIKGPSFVEGVMKLRGRTVPVVDLGQAMRLPAIQTDRDAGVVVMVKIRNRRIGFRVEAVSELVSVPQEAIEAPRSIFSGVDAGFIKGLVYIEDRLVVILDLEAVLSEYCESILQDEVTADVTESFAGHGPLDESTGAKKIISFFLDNELFGADIGEVAEIMEMNAIMPIPNVADFVMGLINLRGTIVPVVDLRTLFGLNKQPLTEESRILIVKEKNLLVGVIVDRMWESLRIPGKAFQALPEGVAKEDAEYFREICLVEGRMVSILDIAKILDDTASRISLSR